MWSLHKTDNRKWKIIMYMPKKNIFWSLNLIKDYFFKTLLFSIMLLSSFSWQLAWSVPIFNVYAFIQKMSSVEGLKCKFKNAKLLISGGALLLDDLYKTQRHSGTVQHYVIIEFKSIFSSGNLKRLGQHGFRGGEYETDRGRGGEEVWVWGIFHWRLI